MADLALKVRPRTVLGKKVKVLRRAGVTPANIYGHNTSSLAIEADTIELNLLLRRAGKTALVQISVEGEPSVRPVLVRQLTRRATNDALLHVDFFQVSMREKLTVDVPLTLVGNAPAVELFDAIVVQSMDVITVNCLPGNIPSHINVDISTLVDTASNVYIRDLRVPDGVEVMNDPDLPVASVSVKGIAREEEEAEEAAEAVAAAVEEEVEAAEAEVSEEASGSD
ncbi:MAG: 50S ribosomal protein L25 [Dehalococcoidia bacterium]